MTLGEIGEEFEISERRVQRTVRALGEAFPHAVEVRDGEDWKRRFARDSGFNLADYAARAFGAFQNEAEYGDVIRRFSAEAADRAAEWRFHPSQATHRLPDGRQEVRFVASGRLEMAWHLYCWRGSASGTAPNFGVFP